MAQTEIRDGIIWVIEPEGEWALGPVPEPVEPEPIHEPIEDKITRLEEQNLILMDALATTFEELLELRAIVEGGTGA